MTGLIKKLVRDKGYGFIRPDGARNDIFFHCSALPENGDFDELDEGQQVTFDEGTGNNDRPRAINVRVA